VYPYGVPGAVNVTAGDLSRLQPDEFLNDTLIEFGFKCVTSFPRLQKQALTVFRVFLKELEATYPELVSQVYVFSSFFYKKLNRRKYAMFAPLLSICSHEIASKKATIVYVNGPQRLISSARNTFLYPSMNSA